MSWRVEIEATAGALHLDVVLSGARGPLALVGPNGSGKSTLLRAIVGAHRPTRGSIELDGTLLFSAAAGIDVPSEERSVGYVPQGYGLFPHLRVVDNVAFGFSTGRRRRRRRQRHRVALHMLRRLGCDHLADRLPAHLSGGEQQRVALARALVTEPHLLLLDEPLAALDAATRRSVRSFLATHLRTLQRPSILVTHDVRDVLALDAEICVIEAGRIVQRGDVHALQRAPATDFVAEFVGLPGGALAQRVAP